MTLTSTTPRAPITKQDNYSSYKHTHASYLIGGPLLHDGLSPTVLEYSRILTLSNCSEQRLLPRLPLSPSLEPYVLCKLSSNVLVFIIDTVCNAGMDAQRRGSIFFVLAVSETLSLMDARLRRNPCSDIGNIILFCLPSKTQEPQRVRWF